MLHRGASLFLIAPATAGFDHRTFRLRRSGTACVGWYRNWQKRLTKAGAA